MQINEKSSNCSVIRIDYSAFCYDPESTLRDVCKFLNISFEKGLLNPFPNTQHIIGADSIVLKFKKLNNNRSKIKIIYKKKRK